MLQFLLTQIGKLKTAVSGISNRTVSKKVQLNLDNAYSSGWAYDFLGLPTVTTRALFKVYNASQAEWMDGMKRETDQQIAISNVQTALEDQIVYVSGVFM